MNKLNVLFLAMTAMALSSCRQEADDLESQMFIEGYGTSLLNCRPTTYTEQFDVLWNGLNQNYVAWMIEDYDWDEVYRTQRSVPMSWDARLEADPDDAVSDDEFKEFYEEILKPLHDHHFMTCLWNFRAKQNTLHYISPSDIRIKQRDNYDDMLRLGRMHDQCLGNYGTSIWTFGLETLNKRGQLAPITEDAPYLVFEDLDNWFMAELAVIKVAGDKYVPYLHWNRCNFSEHLQEEKKNDRLYAEGTASKFLQTYGDLVKKYGEAGQLGGVILDVRINAGGDTGDYAHLLGRLLEPGTRLIVGNTVKKNGVGRLDYGPSTPFGFYIYDYNQYVVSKEPIVVLCDGYTMSMGELTTYSAKLLPNGHVIGDRTYGAFNGLDMQYDRTYSGSFGDSENGPLFVYTPSYLTTPIDGTMIESVGVMPDEYIPYDEKIVDAMIGDIDNITDAHIEAAIKYIQGK